MCSKSVLVTFVPRRFEVLEVLPVLQVGDSQVRDGFRVVQVEDLHVLQRGQVLQAQVGDLRVGQVDALAAAAGAPASPGRRPSPRRCSGRRRSTSPAASREQRPPSAAISAAGSSSAAATGDVRAATSPASHQHNHAANHGDSCIVSGLSVDVPRGRSASPALGIARFGIEDDLALRHRLADLPVAFFR